MYYFDQTVPNVTNSGTDFVTNTRKNLQSVRDAVMLGTMPGWNFSIPTCNISNGTITGTTLTVTTITSGYLCPGMTLVGSGITSGTKVVSQLTGNTFSTGTYTVSTASTTSAIPIVASSSSASTPAAVLYSKSTLEKALINYTWDVNNNCTVADYWYLSTVNDPSVGVTANTWYNIGTETNTFDVDWNCTATVWTNLPS